MAGSKNSINGSWLGNYYYDAGSQPFGFEAVFVEHNGSIEGSILDDGQLGEAKVFGKFADPMLKFTKKYNSGVSTVSYEGIVTDEGKKIAGTWTIGNMAKGKWTAWRQDEEEIPDLQTEDELDETLVLEREKVMVRPMTQKQK
ncbi:MAG: hypothetical protein K2X27_22645 [Candidatus Obscuribacterales bacterium]|nr:hypothetical protein [Candidatus Obscuribacterales bacterium]